MSVEMHAAFKRLSIALKMTSIILKLDKDKKLLVIERGEQRPTRAIRFTAPELLARWFECYGSLVDRSFLCGFESWSLTVDPRYSYPDVLSLMEIFETNDPELFQDFLAELDAESEENEPKEESYHDSNAQIRWLWAKWDNDAERYKYFLTNDGGFDSWTFSTRLAKTFDLKEMRAMGSAVGRKWVIKDCRCSLCTSVFK